MAIFSFCLSVMKASAQFPGFAGSPGSTALHKDTFLFKAWAKGCLVLRGYRNIADTSLGKSEAGTAESAIGIAGNQGGVVSLGDGGMATLTFQRAITNGPGPDFAVFENSFADDFLELAFVEVSSDGFHFIRFPAVSFISDSQQTGPFDARGRASLIHNLAGKYRSEFGTPFDLEDLKDSVKIDINSVSHVRVIDVVGSINPLFARHDKNGNTINDPFPTPFPSGGFDLDAVGLIHQNNHSKMELSIFPNPVLEGIILSNNNAEDAVWQLIDMVGNELGTGFVKKFSEISITLKHLRGSCYCFRIQLAGGDYELLKFIKI